MFTSPFAFGDKFLNIRNRSTNQIAGDSLFSSEIVVKIGIFRTDKASPLLKVPPNYGYHISSVHQGIEKCRISQ